MSPQPISSDIARTLRRHYLPLGRSFQVVQSWVSDYLMQRRRNDTSWCQSRTLLVRSDDRARQYVRLVLEHLCHHGRQRYQRTFVDDRRQRQHHHVTQFSVAEDGSHIRVHWHGMLCEFHSGRTHQGAWQMQEIQDVKGDCSSCRQWMLEHEDRKK